MFLSARRTRGERGSLAPSVAAMIIILFLLGGLIIDGARALGARSRASAYAEEGARIAGQGVSFDQGKIDLDRAAMRSNAEDYCARISASDDGVETCTVSQEAGDIVFTVGLTIDKGILGMVSSDPTMTFNGEGRAIAEIGITEAQGSADEPTAIASQRVPGDEVEVTIREGETGCFPGERWKDAPATLSPKPFRYWTRLQYQTQPRHCPVPPVCPGPGREIAVPHTYSPTPKQKEITEQVLSQDAANWHPVYKRCPIIPGNSESFLYTFAPKPDCELGELPGKPPSCKPLDLPPCPVGKEPGNPPKCNPLKLPVCKEGKKPGKPPECRPPKGGGGQNTTPAGQSSGNHGGGGG